MKRKVNTEELINWWLEKYHGTTLEKLKEKHPDRQWWDGFYQMFKVTQKEHDEWEEWAKAYTKKVTGIKGELFGRSWGWVYLDAAPAVMSDKDVLRMAKELHFTEWSECYELAKRVTDPEIKQQIIKIGQRLHHYEEGCCGLL